MPYVCYRKFSGSKAKLHGFFYLPGVQKGSIMGVLLDIYKESNMYTNLFTLELLQALGGTTDNTTGGGNSIFNSSLPILLSEFQVTKRISDKCGEIIDSTKDMDGASILLSAVAGVKQKSDDALFRQRQKISKEAEDGFDDAGRQTFLALDKNTQDELLPIIAGDTILQQARAINVAKSQIGQQSPRQ